ncbi:hypothetical protein, conserved [Eimeria necatrix]|uniref:Uncharacterized protein n=1 Tax=Eimeria necatrix TaxID=51315 RepID=U6MWR6_9EIME|nr:hypothetical protein, conserved [Eimeria necatrix]CDJ68416.1 hypothetical protein, conserved [Eimeria necatrix]
MVRGLEERKCDLVLQLESRSANSKLRNSALKALKRFPPAPRKELDAEFEARSCSFKKSPQMHYFMCWRCDKPKATNCKVLWSTSKGLRVICPSCYNALLDLVELERAKRENAIYFDFQKKRSQKTDAK